MILRDVSYKLKYEPISNRKSKIENKHLQANFFIFFSDFLSA